MTHREQRRQRLARRAVKAIDAIWSVVAAVEAGDAGLTARREQELTKLTVQLAEMLGQVVMTSKALRPPKQPG